MHKYQRDERLQALFDWMNDRWARGVPSKLMEDTLQPILSLEQRLKEAEQDLLAHQKNTDQEVGDLTQQIEQLEAEAAAMRQFCENFRTNYDSHSAWHRKLADGAHGILQGTAGRELLEELEALRQTVDRLELIEKYYNAIKSTMEKHCAEIPGEGIVQLCRIIADLRKAQGKTLETEVLAQRSAERLIALVSDNEHVEEVK